MPRIGIVAALSFEARTLSPRKPVPGRPTPVAPGLDLVWSGMDPRAVERAAESLAGHGCGLLLGWGVAGALRPGVRRGDLVLPGTIIGADGRRHTPHATFAESFGALLPATLRRHGGPIAEARSPVGSPSEKRALGGRTGAAAVDMESAIIARVAARRGIRFHAVRVIIDEVGTALPSFVAEGGGPRRWLPAPLRRPADLPRLVPLVRGYLCARRSLRTAATALRQGSGRFT
ncbi:MAG: hypothetical protein ACLFRP_01985 [Puniceicoccaceae bacterium]